jgi:hypothetical protein
VTQGGVRVAGLPDLYAQLQEEDSTQSRQDWLLIRDRLLDPSADLLPDAAMQTEMDTVWALLPPDVREHPDALLAVRMTGFAIYAQETLYGHPSIRRTNQMVGELEEDRFQTVASYHNAFGIYDDLASIQEHCDRSGASPEQRLDMMVADAWSDLAYGNGRMSVNKDGHDELRSAHLLFACAVRVGYPRPVALWEAVFGTTFDEGTGAQAGKDNPDPVVRGAAGADLQPLSESYGLVQAFRLLVEDLMSARFSGDRVLGRLATAVGQRIRTVEEGLESLDTYGQLFPGDLLDPFIDDSGRLDPDAPVRSLKDVALARLRGSAAFIDPDTGKGHAYPPGWTMENVRMRRELARMGRHLADQIEYGTMTFIGAYLAAQEHAEFLDKNPEYR